MPQLWNQLPPASILAIYALVFFVLKRVYFELTTGASRRALIKKNGCQPVVRYPHKGLLGKLFGLDTLLEGMHDAKEGHLFRNARPKLFKNQHTVEIIDVSRKSELLVAKCGRSICDGNAAIAEPKIRASADFFQLL